MSDIPTTRPFTAASFDQFISAKKLMATRCTHCGSLDLPPRAICPKCRSEALEWVELSGKGRLAAFTVISIGPSFMVAQGYDRHHPYVTGIVELEEGVRVSALILGINPGQPASIQVGTPLRVDYLPQGEGGKLALAFRVSTAL